MLSQKQADRRLFAAGGATATAILIIGLRQLIQSRREAARLRKRRSAGSATATPALTPLIEQANRELFVPGSNGQRELLIVNGQGRINRVLIKPTKQSTFDAHRKDFVVVKRPLDQSGQLPAGTSRPSSKKTSSKKVDLKEFLRQLRAILKIIIPRSTSKEVFLFATHTSFLLLRTYLSLLVAKLDGYIVKAIVSADLPGFLRGLAYWYLLAIPSTYTNSMIRYLQQKLSISFRTRLTRCEKGAIANHSFELMSHLRCSRPVPIEQSQLLPPHQPRQPDRECRPIHHDGRREVL